MQIRMNNAPDRVPTFEAGRTEANTRSYASRDRFARGSRGTTHKSPPDFPEHADPSDRPLQLRRVNLLAELDGWQTETKPGSRRRQIEPIGPSSSETQLHSQIPASDGPNRILAFQSTGSRADCILQEARKSSGLQVPRNDKPSRITTFHSTTDRSFKAATSRATRIPGGTTRCATS